MTSCQCHPRNGYNFRVDEMVNRQNQKWLNGRTFVFFFHWTHPVSFDSVAPCQLSYLLTFFFLPNVNSLFHMLHSVGSVVLHLFIIFVVGSSGTQEYNPEHKYGNKSFFLLSWIGTCILIWYCAWSLIIMESHLLEIYFTSFPAFCFWVYLY